MAESRWVYELASGRFLRGGFYLPGYDPATEGVAVFPDADPHPDPTRERYDAAAPNKRRAATQTELDADATVARITAAQREAGGDVIRATVAWMLFKMLGRKPTLAEISTAIGQWKTAYQELT